MARLPIITQEKADEDTQKTYAAIIAQKTLSNYFNHINETDLDLPEAPEI